MIPCDPAKYDSIILGPWFATPMIQDINKGMLALHITPLALTTKQAMDC